MLSASLVVSLFSYLSYPLFSFDGLEAYCLIEILRHTGFIDFHRGTCAPTSRSLCALCLRSNGHSLLLSSYLSRIGRIENLSCNACGHSSQGTFHLIVHCPATDSLRRSLFCNFLSLRPLAQALEGCLASGAPLNHAPIPRKGLGNNNSKIEITALLGTKGVSKFRHSSTCKQNYVTICNLLS